MSIYIQDRFSFVKESVESILNQTYSNFHYYLIFDGPVKPDVEQYITTIKDDRITLFKLDINKGLAVALNTLLRVVLKNPEYRYIARMDADDISMLERFEIQRIFLIKNPTIACLGSWYKEIDEDGFTISQKKLPVTNDEIVRFFYRRSPFAHPSVMFRLGMIRKTGLYPENTFKLEDYALWSYIIKDGFKVANIPLYLLNFRRDRNFYKRRSGIVFGINYIKTRFLINKNLKVPLYIYVYSILVGLFRMLPVPFVEGVYNLDRRSLFKFFKKFFN